jgi:hypothetical protein
MCLAMNDDRLEPGERCASTSNRNFEGRQGAGGRTHLVSPAMAAAARDCRAFRRRRAAFVLGKRDGAVSHPHRDRRAARPRQRRHRRDHPKQFLKSIRRAGFGVNLFDAWRYVDHGEPGMDRQRAGPIPTSC